jgi:hypothetical protein
VSISRGVLSIPIAVPTWNAASLAWALGFSYDSQAEIDPAYALPGIMRKAADSFPPSPPCRGAQHWQCLIA